MSVLGITASSTVLTNSASKVADDSGFSLFDSILDTINPLQHIPIVSNIYRNLTGDTQNGLSNIVGGTLFGGPIGGAVALASEVAKSAFNQSDSKEVALTASNTQKQANNAYSKARALTTKDWLYPSDKPVEVASNLTSEHKIKTTTKDWLSA